MQFRSKTNKEITRVVRNFNQKISRLEKMGRENLPDKISIKELKNNIKSSSDLRKELNKLKRFSKRGAEDVITSYKVPITKWEKQNIGIEVRTAKAKITRELKRMGFSPTTSKGFNTGKLATNEVQTLIKQYKSLSTSKILMAKTKSEREEKRQTVNKYNYRYSNAAAFVLRQNMIEMIDKIIVSKDNEKLKEDLKNKLKQMSTKEFKDLYYQTEDINNFLERYKLEKEGLDLDYGEATNEIVLENLLQSIIKSYK